MMIKGRKVEKGLMLLFFVIACVSGNGIPLQKFIRQPPDKTAVIGGHIILPCQVKNKRGMLQWTRDGFGLGVERNLTGFDRYHMSGYDEEGDYTLNINPVLLTVRSK